jgi:hypothetical protein
MVGHEGTHVPGDDVRSTCSSTGSACASAHPLHENTILVMATARSAPPGPPPGTRVADWRRMPRTCFGSDGGGAKL